MAYTTPPTFSDGSILSASQLNILSDDVEYLYGTVQQTNAATFAYELGPGDGASEEAARWVIRHKTNTFRYSMIVTQGTIDSVDIDFQPVAGGTAVEVFTDGTNRSATYTYSGTVDISAKGFTVGNWYTVIVTATGQSGSSVNKLIVYDLREIT
jgi:hypothetical protein